MRLRLQCSWRLRVLVLLRKTFTPQCSLVTPIVVEKHSVISTDNSEAGLITWLCSHYRQGFPWSVDEKWNIVFRPALFCFNNVIPSLRGLVATTAASCRQ